MRVYRVHYYDHAEGSRGFCWFTNKRAAERAAREVRKRDGATSEPEVEAFDIALTRAGLVSALIAYASHPDNG